MRGMKNEQAYKEKAFMVCNAYKMPEVQQNLGGGLSNSGDAAGMP